MKVYISVTPNIKATAKLFKSNPIIIPMKDVTPIKIINLSGVIFKGKPDFLNSCFMGH